MNFDELKEAWQSQGGSGKICVDREQLLQLLKRNQHSMEQSILWRDMREAMVALVMIPLCIWVGKIALLHWTWYLLVPALIWLVGFLFYMHWKQRKYRCKSGDSMWQVVEASLKKVNYQIQMLRKVFWWYLFPPAIPMAIFYYHIGEQIGYTSAWIAQVVFGILVFWGIYELNQNTVRKELVPHRNDLTDFLRSLSESDESKSINK